MNLSKLYTSYDILSDAKEKISEHQKEYNDAILATRGGEKEKQLAAQIISKFFKHFPEQQNSAIDAIFDLCEDDDTAIRIAAIKTLPTFCKDNNKYVPRVADISAQLLQLEDPQEYNIASSTLLQVLKIDPTTVIKCMYKLINDKDGTTPIIREKCIKFLTTKIKVLDKSVVTQEVEELMANEAKNAVVEATEEEFVPLMTYLTTTKQAQALVFQQDLINIVGEQLEIDQKFEPVDDSGNNTDRVIAGVKYILPFFSLKLESSKFILFFCNEILPKWDMISAQTHGSQYQLAIVQQLAELSSHCGALENPTELIERIFEKLKIYMPPPPEDTDSTKMPHFNFTMVEALLYTFHRLARQKTEFLTGDQNLLKDFRSRLMYFSRGVQSCLKVINMSDKEKIFSPEEKKIREISPKLLNNINTLIKDLFYQPPIYKCNVQLSFKIELKHVHVASKAAETVLSGGKRHVPIIYESNGASNNKQVRQSRGMGEKKIYTPPSGKFSHNFQNSDRGRSFRSRGQRGGMRGRGRGGYRN